MTKSIRTIATTLAFAIATLVGGTALAAAPGDVGAHSQDEVHESTRFDAAVTLEGEININTASAAELELLPGIGPSIAARIVSYRKDRPFKQRNNIMRIRGVGQKTFAKIKDYLIVEGQTTLRVAK
ncbi:ComE operon protein 1 [Enhygromyxa salina]|uniref:ComE operon protein 1 n=1 Tax=Enhygromyxa salina TaxID=215803 RepID=A0A2S9XCF0_9BACT|nr:helix-hairpin-helix domain-containing protein [Enhygromyxa salina]PRP90534.1 ComE operon protein 1 [Enhygromyxa salina]